VSEIARKVFSTALVVSRADAIVSLTVTCASLTIACARLTLAIVRLAVAVVRLRIAIVRLTVACVRLTQAIVRLTIACVRLTQAIVGLTVACARLTIATVSLTVPIVRPTDAIANLVVAPASLARLPFAPTMTTASLLLVALLSTALLACENENPPPRTPVPGTDQPDLPYGSPNDDVKVVDRLANVVCDREQSCGTIGPGAYFKGRDECLETVRAKLSKQLNHDQCPAGIDKDALASCISSYQATECAAGSDAITRSARCPLSDLCMKSAPAPSAPPAASVGSPQ
jgi:hypothetical protein